ncbi:YciI family protein [Dictyobacter arantiisoli]|nr:YciI family protein [Dictyobacter arantiisoli]
MENRATFICQIRALRPGFADEMLPEELAAMQAHSEYLDQLKQETTFYLIGPCLDRAFGIVIFEADSLEAAHEMMAHDPSVERGVMSFEVHPFKISFWQPPQN